MGYLVTQYLARLPEPILLSETLGYRLDNLRSSDEIDQLAKPLWRSLSERWKGMVEDPASDSLDAMIDRFLGVERSVGVVPYPAKTSFESIRRLASLMVVLRYADLDSASTAPDSDGSLSEAESLDLEVEGEMSEQRAVAFAALLSLLVHTDGDEYYGASLCFDSGVSGPIDEGRSSLLFAASLLHLVQADSDDEENLEEEVDDAGDATDAADRPDWRMWQEIKRSLAIVGHQVGRQMSLGDEEMLLHAGDVLRAASETRDPRFKLSLLVSVIEMLLTHSPDFMRYNVEDSISKQFVVKTATVLYKAGSSDLDRTKKTLSRLYRLRSAAAHGDFKAFSKLIGTKQHPVLELEDIVGEVYQIIRKVLTCYLEDPAFIRFLKDN